ncbi:MAG: NADH-quinone oxidoreductase subunit B [Planctomycetota bacterium]|nr:MAG: NADH-quinone oxidoreductase subunit B [Planctomycetota bacterium]
MGPLGGEPAGGGEFAVTKLDYALDMIKKHGINWCRKHSVWPMPFATACCGIEFMATAASRYDMARFGSEAVRFSPRQADLLVVAGRVVVKMLPVLQRIYLQMAEPKWVIAMGACASSGGVFDTYAVVQGIDQFVPVDVYLPGCPPRPETVLEGLMAIQRIIAEDGVVHSSERQGLGLVVQPPEMVTLGPGFEPREPTPLV